MGTVALIATVLEMIDKFGIPLAKKVFNEWADGVQGQEPTLEEIKALKDLMKKRPEDYFK